jgi:hypothetical protein
VSCATPRTNTFANIHEFVRTSLLLSVFRHLTDAYRIALYHNRLEVVQASLLGSILVNLLLILGIAIIAGSLRHHQLAQNKEDAQTLACLLSFSVLSLLIPVSHFWARAPLTTKRFAECLLPFVPGCEDRLRSRANLESGVLPNPFSNISALYLPAD